MKKLKHDDEEVNKEKYKIIHVVCDAEILIILERKSFQVISLVVKIKI